MTLTRPTRISLPPTISDKAVKTAADNYTRLLADHRQASSDLDRDTRALAEAQEADVRSYAEALADGKADPGPVHEEEAKAKLDATHRRVDALAQAIEDAHRHLLSTIEDRAEPWQEREAKALDDTVTAIRETVDKLASLVAEEGHHRAVLGFIERKDRYHVSRRLTSMRKPNGDAETVDTFVELVREAYEPKPEPQPSRHAAPGSPWPVQGVPVVPGNSA